jgi:hypothetical protein
MEPKNWGYLGTDLGAGATAPQFVQLHHDVDEIVGGDGGIRTLDRPLQAYNGLANRRLQPLGHISNGADMHDAAASRKRPVLSYRIGGEPAESARAVACYLCNTSPPTPYALFVSDGRHQCRIMA